MIAYLIEMRGPPKLVTKLGCLGNRMVTQRWKPVGVVGVDDSKHNANDMLDYIRTHLPALTGNELRLTMFRPVPGPRINNGEQSGILIIPPEKLFD